MGASSECRDDRPDLKGQVLGEQRGVLQTVWNAQRCLRLIFCVHFVSLCVPVPSLTCPSVP